MKKTFYTVKYITWGMDKPEEKWFDNRAEAYAFYKRASDSLRTEKPVAHTYIKVYLIAAAEKHIANQKLVETMRQEYQAAAATR